MGRARYGPVSGLLGRRAMFQGAAVTLGAVAVAGCSALSTEPTGSRQGKRASATGKEAKTPQEAPSLAQQVADGKLEPVAKRLPDEPLVIEPTDKIGTYGGTWHTTTSGPGDSSWLSRTIGYDPLLRWSPDWGRVLPNIATKVTARREGHEWQIALRPGVRWSDGEPYTADDVVFAFNDVLGNEELYPGGGWQPAARARKVDEHTVRVEFERPGGLFPENLCETDEFGRWPRHYMEKFHKSYNEGADKLAKKNGLQGWVELFGAKADRWSNPELPTVNAWRVTTPLGVGDRMVAERNPYYFKVDPRGSQLPYLDKVVFEVITNPETMLLKATHGDFDMHCRHFNTPQDKPVLARSRGAGGYRFYELAVTEMNEMQISLNQTHSDPQLRKLFQDVNFRIGLSHAINRPEIISAVYQRQGEPWQDAPRPESEFFDREMAKQYTQFDVAKANSYLDKAGYSARDGDGYRLRPDGERIRIVVDLANGYRPTWADVLELVKGYWKKVGVDMRVNPMERTLFDTRIYANKHDAAVWYGAGGMRDALLGPIYYFPYSSHDSRYAELWAVWYETDGKDGERPPEAPRRQMELYRDLLASVDEGERKKLFGEILRISKEQFYTIGTVLPTKGYGIVRDDFHNVPSSMPSSWLYSEPGPTRTEQYFSTRD